MRHIVALMAAAGVAWSAAMAADPASPTGSAVASPAATRGSSAPLTSARGATTSSQAASAPSPEKLKDIRTLMQILGTDRNLRQVAENLLATMKKAAPDVSADFWVEAAKEIDTAPLLSQVALAYHRHFSHDEIKQLIAFFKTPLGERFVQQQGVLQREVNVLAAQWIGQATRRVNEKAKQRDSGGYQ